MEKENKTAWVIGRKPVQEFLNHRPADALRVLIAEGAKLNEELRVAVERSGVATERIARRDLDRLLAEEQHHGVALEVRQQAQIGLSELIDRSLSDSGNKTLAILDQITDPHNLGAVLRAAEGAGIDGVIATRDKSSPFTPAVVRASAGASNFMPLVQTGNLQRTLAELKSRGYWIVGMQLDERSQNLYEAQIPQPCAVVFGAEGAGLRRLTQRECDLTVVIPMQGVLESLNVSQAAAVFFYELHRRSVYGQ